MNHNSESIEIALTNIGDIFNAIDGLETLPLGSIIAWNEIDVESHPLNWVECDGRNIQGFKLLFTFMWH
jgi:hypothetical protein